MSNLAVSEPDAARVEASAGVRAPLLSGVLDRCGRSERRIVADLAAVQPGLLERLTGTRTRLVVADLPARRAAGAADWYLLDAAMPAAYWREPVDVVLCWDLLNYLDAGQLAATALALRERAAPGCRIHALIQYSALTMPAHPGRMRINSALELRTVSPTGEGHDIAAPRYSPKALNKAMPALSVERTMLLGNGMQEFVFAVPTAN